MRGGFRQFVFEKSVFFLKHPSVGVKLLVNLFSFWTTIWIFFGNFFKLCVKVNLSHTPASRPGSPAMLLIELE